MQIKILNPKLGKEIPLPQYATQGSAGLDLRACLDKPLELKPNESIIIQTGLSIYIQNPLLAGLIVPRSGLGHKEGIVIGNLIGLIDSDYQGELIFSCWNRSLKSYEIQVGQRLAQLVIIKINQIKFKIVKDFDSKTDRGIGGYGSTGAL